MSKPFVYGTSVEGDLFTDRELETERLRLNFENGINSAYVQQLAWNIFAMTQQEVDEEAFAAGLEATIAQAAPLFVEQVSGLSTFQLNFIRALCHGFRRDFTKREVTSRFNLGTRSNLPKLLSALTARELIDTTEEGTTLADPLFELWFKQNMM